MEKTLFVELSLIIISALAVSGIMRLLKQPLMIGYIIVGILLSPTVFGLVHDHDSIATFSQIGITLLLFMIGLNLNPRHIKETGSVSLITGFGQVTLTGLMGFGLGRLVGFDNIVSIYIGVGLAFSSAIVIMKMLSDQQNLQALHGKVATGILIVQDLIAMLGLMTVSAIAKGGDLQTMIISTLVKGVGIIAVLFLFSKHLLPQITKRVSNNQELLLLFSLGWCMALASFFYFFDFSIEIGALLAGIALSMSPYRYEISAKMKPLRDFFIMLFFVLLGTEIAFDNITQFILPIIVFSAYVLLIKPLIIMTIMGVLGYTKRNSFKTSTTLAQISEFSLILVGLGAKVGHLDDQITSFVTLLGLITITGSTYYMKYSDQIFDKLNNYLNIFERRGHKVDQHIKHTGEKHDILLIGFSKLGSELVKSFTEMKKKFLVVDFDPRNIFNLTRQGVDCRYGDISNTELFNELNFSKAKMVVSTIRDYDTNLLLIHKIRQINKKAIIIVTSHQIDEAISFYDEGANYVVMPNYISGYHTSGIINDYGFDVDKFLNEKANHLNKLLIKKQINFGKN